MSDPTPSPSDGTAQPNDAVGAEAPASSPADIDASQVSAAAGTTTTTPVQSAVSPPPPAPSDLILAPTVERKEIKLVALKPAWVAAAVATGVAADVALRRPGWNNIAFTILVVVIAVGLGVSGLVRTMASRAMLAAAVLFGLFLALRDEPMLTGFNFAAIAILIAGAAAVGNGRSVWDWGPKRVANDGLGLLEELMATPFAGAEQAQGRYRQWGEVESSASKSVVRGIAIAAPIVIVLGLLLASADAVFGSFFSIFDGLFGGAIFGHLILAAIGVWIMGMLLRFAHKDSTPIQDGSGLSLGSVEIGVVLGAINVLFGAFAIAQVLTVLGGANEALARAGIDPKAFARQGFFQLLWVAAITLAVITTLHVASKGDAKARRFAKFGGLITVGLTLLIVAVAITRILYYIGEGGLTPKRLYAFVIAVWIGAAFALVAPRISGFRPNTDWFLPAAMMLSLAILGVLNIVNPQRLIAEDNIKRNDSQLIYHVQAKQFRGEGLAHLVKHLDRLESPLDNQVRMTLCVSYSDSEYSESDTGDALSWNRAKQKGRTALADVCDS